LQNIVNMKALLTKARLNSMRVISELEEFEVREVVELVVKRSCLAWSKDMKGLYTKSWKSCSAKELLSIVKEKIPIESSIFTDTFRSYDGLVSMGYKKHYRIAHGKNEFAKERNHINGIENFWGLAKVRLSKFRGMHKSTFNLHLKECEFRYNYRHKNLYDLMLEILRNNPLKLSWT